MNEKSSKKISYSEKRNRVFYRDRISYLHLFYYKTFMVEIWYTYKTSEDSLFVHGKI